MTMKNSPEVNRRDETLFRYQNDDAVACHHLAVDDLNTWLLGDADRYAGNVIAPHIRRLAGSGVVFNRAYTASPFQRSDLDSVDFTKVEATQ